MGLSIKRQLQMVSHLKKFEFNEGLLCDAVDRLNKLAGAGCDGFLVNHIKQLTYQTYTSEDCPEFTNNLVLFFERMANGNLSGVLA